MENIDLQPASLSGPQEGSEARSVESFDDVKAAVEFGGTATLLKKPCDCRRSSSAGEAGRRPREYPRFWFLQALNLAHGCDSLQFDAVTIMRQVERHD